MEIDDTPKRHRILFAMSQRLEDELEELQLSQYYEAFVDQGFDTWETILDITESDLYVSSPRFWHCRSLNVHHTNPLVTATLLE